MALTRDRARSLLDEQAGRPVHEAGRTVAATQLYELLLSFDPRSFAAALTDKPELYLRLVNALSRLCEAEASIDHHHTQDTLIASKTQAAGSTEKKLLSKDELKDMTRQINLI